ncbi:hypothetical protein MES4922_190565 [Mesorhizobium ventifaucium]|uniref:Uncharacterized protein n=1 Tax=Mesorhizobium ventifaucium TaxID=666020 RepID=A0ABN8JLU8_9HYPH|nr:hypothetical protein MES4922_190565 [Mesorhizobium ventifaucium]
MTSCGRWNPFVTLERPGHQGRHHLRNEVGPAGAAPRKTHMIRWAAHISRIEHNVILIKGGNKRR